MQAEPVVQEVQEVLEVLEVLEVRVGQVAPVRWVGLEQPVVQAARAAVFQRWSLPLRRVNLRIPFRLR